MMLFTGFNLALGRNRVVHRNRLWKYSGQSPPTWLKATEEQTAVLVEDNATEDEISSGQGRYNPEESSDPAEDSHGSHSDEQDNANATRSTRRRKPPERYGQNSSKKKRGSGVVNWFCQHALLCH